MLLMPVIKFYIVEVKRNSSSIKPLEAAHGFILALLSLIKRRNKSQGVLLTNQSKDLDKIVSADAVRFGGGMGIVEREGTTSGKPKFAEGSRYWLQFAGMSDTLTYNLNRNGR